MTDQIAIDIQNILTQPNMLRVILVLLASMLVAYWLSRFLAYGIIRIAQMVATRGDKETDDQKNLRYRQIETYLSIFVAIIRVLVVGIVGYIAWLILNPFPAENKTVNGFAAIGAGTFFAVIAGQTLGPVLRDITNGAVMITEGWFHVGDYVKLEPFSELAGVVERFTLRSTRIRALNGEIIWVNNQSISGARITPRGVRSIAVEVFVRNKDKGVAKIQKLIDDMPKGKILLARPLRIESVEQWSENSWHITVTGQTPPGREWLIQEYFLEELKAIDDKKKPADKILSRQPMTHMDDRIATKRFSRAVRVHHKHDDRK